MLGVVVQSLLFPSSLSASTITLSCLFDCRGCWESSSLSELFVCALVLPHGLWCTVLASVLLFSSSSLSDSTLKHLRSNFRASCGFTVSVFGIFVWVLLLVVLVWVVVLHYYFHLCYLSPRISCFACLSSGVGGVPLHFLSCLCVH